eukprot:760006-Hanusia_phi.AAC.4
MRSFRGVSARGSEGTIPPEEVTHSTSYRACSGDGGAAGMPRGRVVQLPPGLKGEATKYCCREK